MLTNSDFESKPFLSSFILRQRSLELENLSSTHKSQAHFFISLPFIKVYSAALTMIQIWNSAEFSLVYTNNLHHMMSTQQSSEHGPLVFQLSKSIRLFSMKRFLFYSSEQSRFLFTDRYIFYYILNCRCLKTFLVFIRVKNNTILALKE